MKTKGSDQVFVPRPNFGHLLSIDRPAVALQVRFRRLNARNGVVSRLAALRPLVTSSGQSGTGQKIDLEIGSWRTRQDSNL